MNKRILVVAMAVASLQLTGCGSTSTPFSGANYVDPGSNAGVGIADQRLASSEFKTQGIKFYYSLFGDIEAIEVTGYAAAWGNSMSATRESYRVAELEAKKSLNDFINKESIRSSTSVRMISENLEHAQDNNTNKFASNLAASDTDEAVREGTENNTAVRNNALKIASKLSTTISTQNAGIISGLYVKDARVIDGGRGVMVVMRWDKKTNASRTQIRNLMAQ